MRVDKSDCKYLYGIQQLPRAKLGAVILRTYVLVPLCHSTPLSDPSLPGAEHTHPSELERHTEIHETPLFALLVVPFV